MEELEALSSPRFNKIDTPKFGVAMDGQPTPMQTQTANFPNHTGSHPRRFARPQFQFTSYY
eukprot:4271282-Amphidinium_carterae.2